MGYQGAMYTVAGTSRQRLLRFGSVPPLTRHSLGAYGWVVALAYASFGVGVELLKFPSSVVTRPSNSVYRLLETVQGELLSVDVGCVVSRVALCLYRVAFLALFFFYET